MCNNNKQKQIIMLNFTSKIEKLKKENDDLVNFRMSFRDCRLFLEGELIEDGINNGYYDAGTIAYFYIPTAKGYISSEWKNNELFKTGRVDVTDDILNSLEPFLQTEAPKTFIRNTGISSANAIANFITKTGGDIYCTA